MHRKFLIIVFVLALAISAQAAPGTITVSADTTYFQRDTFFMITVTADPQLVGVKAIQLNVDVNPAVLLADTSSTLPVPLGVGNMFVDNDSITYFFTYTPTANGRLTIDIAVLGDTNTVSGPGEIVHIPFKTVWFGQSDIAIDTFRIRNNQNQPIDANIVNAWARVCRFVGDVNADNRIDIGDLTYLIDYLFILNVGPPDPPASGDTNCDVNIDIVDLTVLIDYLFITFDDMCDKCL